MAHIEFDRLDESTPYDREQVLTRWRLVDGATYPSAEDSPHGAARRFDGSGGYEADEPGAALMGLRALTVRALVQLDWDALDGQTATLLCRGQGGPTAGSYWAWDVRLAVAGTVATVVLAWQGADGSEAVHHLGTIERGASDLWYLLSVTRETTPAGSHMRLVVDGDGHGELVSDVPIPATPGASVRLGCRRHGDVVDQPFVGAIAWVDVLDVAVTPLQERHVYRERLVWPERCVEDVRGYWFRSSVPLSDSLYERYRMRPLAALQTSVAAAIERRAEAGLPNTAYGQRLIDWERALRLNDTSDLTIAQRQQRAADAVALVAGSSVPFLRAYAARVLGIGEDDLTIIESTNRLQARLARTEVETVGATTREVLSAWRVYGNIETRYHPDTGYLAIGPAALDSSSRYRLPLPADGITGAGFCEVAIPQDARIAVTFGPDPAAASHAEMWAGIMLRTGPYVQYLVIDERQHLLAITAHGGGTPVQEDLGQLPSTSVAIWEVGLLYDDDGTIVRIRGLGGDDDWAEYRPAIATLPTAPAWFGFGTAAVSDTTAEVAIHVRGVRIDWPSQPARRWTVIADVPRDLGVIELLNRKSRATAQASWSRDSEARADSEKTFVGYTPTPRL